MEVMGASHQEWQHLLDHANAGELSMDPSVGEGLDRVCADYLRKLESVLEYVPSISHIVGFGSLPSGEALRDKFEKKATGTDQSLDAVVRKHIDTVQLIRQVVAKSLANAREVDESTSQQITNTGPEE